MTTILITVLFVLQLLSFYFIIILNTKLAKFKSLEKKQERLMLEMDDTISLYLAEMKDENNRLIQELQNVQKPVVEKNIVTRADQTLQQEKKEQQPKEREKKVSSAPNLDSEQRIFVPKNIVANAYSRQQQVGTITVQATTPTIDMVTEKEQEPLTLEQQAIQMFKQGKTTEEIAKYLQKGKTEIDLLLKFHV